jgi:hypothetical protein
MVDMITSVGVSRAITLFLRSRWIRMERSTALHSTLFNKGRLLLHGNISIPDSVRQDSAKKKYYGIHSLTVR